MQGVMKPGMAYAHSHPIPLRMETVSIGVTTSHEGGVGRVVSDRAV
jgi:hypothetical protein